MRFTFVVGTAVMTVLTTRGHGQIDGPRLHEAHNSLETDWASELGFQAKADVDLVLVDDLVGAILPAMQGEELLEQYVLEIEYVQRKGHPFLIRYVAVQSDGRLIESEAPLQAADRPILFLDEVFNGMTFLAGPARDTDERSWLEGLDEDEHLILTAELSDELLGELGAGLPATVTRSAAMRFRVSETVWRTDVRGRAGITELRVSIPDSPLDENYASFLSLNGTCPALVTLPVCIRKNCTVPCTVGPTCCCNAAGPGLECIGRMVMLCPPGNCTGSKRCTLKVVRGGKIAVLRCDCQ